MDFAVTVISPPGYPHSGAFREVAETLHFGLRALGHGSILTSDAKIAGKRHIVLGAHLLEHFPQPLAADALIYNLEQLAGNRFITDYVIELYRRQPLLEYSPVNLPVLDTLGIKPLAMLPIGYRPELTRIRKNRAPDIDVLFFGKINDRRRETIEGMTAMGLRAAGVFACYGRERDALIARAKVMLNLHVMEAKILEMVRISYYLANGCVVLSENSAEPKADAQLADGVAFAGYEHLPEMARALCADAERRAALAARGFELIRERRIEPYLEAVVAAI